MRAPAGPRAASPDKPTGAGTPSAGRQPAMPPSAAKLALRLSREPGVGAEGGELSEDASALVRGAISSPGAPLDPPTRAFLGGLGPAAAEARVHADARAAESARAVGALAYAFGRHVVFGAGRYAPGTPRGDALLAHEVAHVGQGSAAEADAALRGGGPLAVTPVADGTEVSADGAASAALAGRPAGTPEGGLAPAVRRTLIERDLGAVPRFEYSRGEQRATSSTVTAAPVHLAYDDTAGTLTCTFPLRWRWPPGWDYPVRAEYNERFQRTVREAWQNRYTLTQYSGSGAAATPSGRTASVWIQFNYVTAPDTPAGGDETAYTQWLIDTPAARNRWTMQVSPTDIREEVRDPTVELDPRSMDTQTTRASQYTSGRSSFTQGADGRVEYPPYYHYERAGIPVVASGSARQIPAVHEFGHMIGLGDEYILSAGDLADVVRARGSEAGRTAMEQRNRLTDRVMNAGGRIAPDHYRPFAAWLSSLTGSEWRVGAASAPPPAAPRPPRPTP